MQLTDLSLLLCSPWEKVTLQLRYACYMMMECPFVCTHDITIGDLQDIKKLGSEQDDELLKNLGQNKMMNLEMKVSVYQGDPWIKFYYSSYCTVLCHISNGCSTIIDQSQYYWSESIIECFSLFPLDPTYLWTAYYKISGWLFVLMANEQVWTSSQVPKSNGFLPSNLSPTTHCPLRCSLRTGSGHTAVLA